MENLLLETPYKFKKSYGGTPEPQTAQDAPWLRGLSLKIGATRAGINVPRCTPGYVVPECTQESYAVKNSRPA
jgi:hypothetical protein